MEKKKLKLSPFNSSGDDDSVHEEQSHRSTGREECLAFVESPIKLDSASSVSCFDVPQNAGMLDEELFQRRHTIPAVYSGRRNQESESERDDIADVLSLIESDDTADAETLLQKFTSEEILKSMKRNQSYLECDRIYFYLVRKEFPARNFKNNGLNWKHVYENLVQEANVSKKQKESAESLKLETLKAKINSNIKKTKKGIKKAKFVIVEEMGDPEKKTTRKRKI